jgi:hypothetical protein
MEKTEEQTSEKAAPGVVGPTHSMTYFGMPIEVRLNGKLVPYVARKQGADE